MVNTHWNRTIKIWPNPHNNKCSEEDWIIHHQYIMSHYFVLSWCSSTKPMFTLCEVKKNNSNVTSILDQTPSVTIARGNNLMGHHHSTLSLSYSGTPSCSRQYPYCPLCRRLVGRCMMGVVGKAERQRAACPWGWESGITWFRSTSSASVPAGLMWTHIHAVKLVKP